MAVSAKWFTNGIKSFLMGTVTWKTTGGSVIKCALLADTWTPNQDTNILWADISANEIANGNGYTTGGYTMVPSDPTVDAASNETRMDAADVQWTGSTLTARYAVIYSGTTLIGYVDFGANVVSSAGTYTITWDATGVLKITAA